MAKVKNVTTKHFIAEIPKGDEEPEFLPLSKGILSVGSENDETVEEFAYYSGDGTPESEVVSIKKNHPVEGHFLDDEPSHLLIASKEFEDTEGRKVIYKQERSGGQTLTGLATILDVNVSGGPAEEYRPITCTITWDQKPKLEENNGGSGE
jgi:hypothetical protein